MAFDACCSQDAYESPDVMDTSVADDGTGLVYHVSSENSLCQCFLTNDKFILVKNFLVYILIIVCERPDQNQDQDQGSAE